MFTKISFAGMCVIFLTGFGGLSSESIKIDPEQERVCSFMVEMAYAVQLERRTLHLEVFPESDSPAITKVAKWVYEEFSEFVTPDEVANGMNSDCVGLFQHGNKDRLGA